MKKKIVLLAVASVLSFSMVACNSNKKGSEGNATASPNPSPSVDKVAILSADLSDKVKLGEYKGLTITEVEANVTDAQVEDRVKYAVESAATWKEEDKNFKAKEGSKVNIDYVGKLDGKAFDNGSAKAQELIIGNNNYIPGFDTGIIGHKKGETFDMKVTFPKEYPANKELEGKETTFTVTINSVSTEEKPKLTDALVKEKLSKTAKTVKEYKAEVRKQLEDAAKENKNMQEVKNAVQAAMNNAEVKEYPKAQQGYYEELVTNYYTNLATYYGTTLEELYKQAGYTEETFQSDVVIKTAQEMLKQMMVIQAIAKKENIQVSEEEYKKQLPNYLANYQVETEEDLKKQFGEEAIVSIKDELLYDKVGNFLVKNGKLVKATPTPAATATPAATTAPTAEPKK